MNELTLYQQIQAYFAQKVEERDVFTERRPLDGRTDNRAWQAQHAQRLTESANIDYLSHLRDKTEFYALNFPLFERVLLYDSLIVGLDDQQEIIWIDDPWNDDGFSYFLRQERLFEQDFDALRLANLICVSKLNYLMMATVISHVSDVPLMDHQKTFFYHLKLLLFQRRFRICAPCMTCSESITQLGFYVKSHFAEIIKVECRWDGSRFAHSGFVVGKGIGFSPGMLM